MANPSVDGVQATSYQYPNYMANPLYNPSYVDMDTMMASGYTPSNLGGLDYGIFNSLGYTSPYSGMGYDSFGYSGMGYGYGFNPAMAQAMVQSQSIYMDGMAQINNKQRQIRYDGQVADMQYDTRLKDAKDTNYEDSVRRDTNFKSVCDRINDRLEAKDTKAALSAYNYALTLMSQVYEDVDDKRAGETPSSRTAIKDAFARKYQELYGISFRDKINDSLSGAGVSGFQSAWRMQEIMSAEEFNALVDDRNVAFRTQHDGWKTFGNITGGIAVTGAYAAAGAATGGAAGSLIGGIFKSAAGNRCWAKGGKIGLIIGGIAAIGTAIYKLFKKD